MPSLWLVILMRHQIHNLTSIFQPLYQGTIAWNMASRKNLQHCGKFQDVQIKAKQLHTGNARLKYGSAAHVGDAIVLVINCCKLYHCYTVFIWQPWYRSYVFVFRNYVTWNYFTLETICLYLTFAHVLVFSMCNFCCSIHL